jgi:PAS domain S-box-containing protein
MQTFQHLSDVTNLLPLGLMWLDEQGRILSANEKLLEQLSISPEKREYLSIFEIDPYTNLLSWRRLWKRLQKGETIKEEKELLELTGMVLPVRLEYRLVATDQGPLCVASILNIGDAERYRNLYQLTASFNRLGAWIWDLQREEVFFTPELQELLGIDLTQNPIPLPEFLDLIEELIPSAERERMIEQVKSLRDSGDTLNMELVIKANGGQKKRYEMNASAVRFDELSVRIYGTIQDNAVIASRSEEMYMAQFTVDNAREMIFWVRPDASFFYVNDAATQKLGYSQDELLQMRVFDVDEQFSAESWSEQWQEIRAHQQTEGESFHRTKSGKIIPVELNLNYLEFEGEELICALVRDTSLRQQRDRKIRLAEFTIQQFPDMLLWVQQDGQIMLANPVCEEKLGYGSAVLLQHKIWDLLPRLDQQAWKTFVLELQKRKSRTLQDVKRTATGKDFPVELTASFLDFQGEQLVSLYVRDIRADLQKSRRLEFAMRTLEHSNDMIFWVRKDGSFAFCNSAVERVLGYAVEECMEMTVMDLDPKYTKQRMKDTWEKLRSGKSLQLEAALKHKNGSLVPVDVHTYYIRFQHEEYRCSVIRDISPQKEREQNLQNAVNQVEQLRRQLEQEKSYLQEEVNVNYNFNNIISNSPKYRPVLKQVKRVANTDATVLILGETGTGKELLARAIHNLSDRSSRAMVKVNCAALPENLIESELFGHEKGAFTGAYQAKVGRFEMADQGTIFLDEVGELPLELQSKLLRVLQEGEFERLGSTSTQSVSVRVIAATNRDLATLVNEGKFREDLFYRLNVFPIYNLPLRERREDIPLLALHFLKRFGDKMGRKGLQISEASLNRLKRYEFPGNIRELENMIERAVILSSGKSLHVDPEGQGQPKRKKKDQEGFLTFEELQKKHILEALERTNWKVTGKMSASELLKMNGKTLASKMRKFGIRREDFIDT